MLCISAVYAGTRCLSVCLSVTFVDHVKTNKHIFEIFSPSGSHSTILVFPYQRGCRYSDGNPPNGGVECKGVWKNHDFRPIFRFISKITQDRAIVTMEGEWETAPKLSNCTTLNNLEWSLTQIPISRYYSTSNNSKMSYENEKLYKELCVGYTMAKEVRCGMLDVSLTL